MMERTPTPSPRAAANRGGTRPASPKKANRLPLILALVLGVVAAVLIIIYLSSRGSSGVAAADPTLSVVVAAQDIAAGQVITKLMVELKALPEAAVIPNAFKSTDEVLDQKLRYPIAKGEQLSKLRLVGGVTGQGLSFQVPNGLRAFTIPVSVTNTPAALIAPGDFVDVLVSGPAQALRLALQLAATGTQNFDPEKRATVTLLQNVQVLAVQREYVENTGPYDPAARGAVSKQGNVSHVTLALTPEQVQLLWQATTEGKITLALRAFGDGETKPLAAITDPRAQGISFQIPDGLRAFTIPVDVTNTPAALIAPGDFVDVLVSGSMQTLRLARHLAAAWGDNANEDRKVTATLLQNVRVLSVQREFLETGVPDDPALGALTQALGALTQATANDPAVRGALPQKETVSYITLALTPEQGQLLQVVSNEGKIILALRPFGDAQLVAIDPITEPRPELLSYQIPQGWRAFTFPANCSNSPACLIAPGDFIDVLVTFDVFRMREVKKDGEVTLVKEPVGTGAETLVQNQRVLAVRREYLNKDVPQDASVRGALPKNDVSYLTLALTPQLAQRLAMYVHAGAVTVTLRPVGDDQLPVLTPVFEAIVARGS